MNAAIGEITTDHVKEPITVNKRSPIGNTLGFRKCRAAATTRHKPTDTDTPKGTATTESHYLLQRLVR
jgi:hypothetical protein